MKKIVINSILFFITLTICNAQNTFPTSGDAGINTTLPKAPLDIYCINGTGRSAALQINNGPTYSGTTSLTSTNIPNLAPYSFRVNRVVFSGIGTPTTIPVGGLPVSLVTDFVVRNDGRVGISTLTPSYNLDINGTTRSTNLLVTTNLGIGTTAPTSKLHVSGGDIRITNGKLIIGNGTNQFSVASDGKIRAREIKVDLLAIPDYVFKPTYKLMPLPELKAYIALHSHLPNIKSETEYNVEGSIDLGELNTKLLEKVEELTLYIIQLEERMSKLETK